jgi:hypothetical protein
MIFLEGHGGVFLLQQILDDAEKFAARDGMRKHSAFARTNCVMLGLDLWDVFGGGGHLRTPTSADVD